MKNSRFSETQIIAILKEADAGVLVKDICRQHGISATYYNWKSKYGGMTASDLKRMKEMEDKLVINSNANSGLSEQDSIFINAAGDIISTELKINNFPMIGVTTTLNAS